MLLQMINFMKYSLQCACIAHCFFEYVADVVVCNGPSMEPTLYSHNILLTERLSARFHKPSRGDIIVAVSPINPEQFICKRVVALPGDKVYLSKTPDLENYINLLETDLDTPSIMNDNLEDGETITTAPMTIIKYIPRGYVWIEGDNNTNSADSRYYGPIPIGLIRSRVICRIWPISNFKIL